VVVPAGEEFGWVAGVVSYSLFVRALTWRVVNSVALFCFVLLPACSAGAAAAKVLPCVVADLSASASRTDPDSGDEVAIIVKNKGRRMLAGAGDQSFEGHED
jgi:hypothetical protein